MAKRRSNPKKRTETQPSVPATPAPEPTPTPVTQTAAEVEVPGIERQRENVWDVLIRLGLNNIELVNEKLDAYIQMPDGSRVELGRHKLVDLCVERTRILAEAGYVPLEETFRSFKVPGEKYIAPTQALVGINPSSITVAFGGMELGKVNDRGVFFSQDDDLFLPLVEATSSKLGPVPGITHRGIHLPVANRPMAVSVYGELEHRKRRAEAAANPPAPLKPIVAADSRKPRAMFLNFLDEYELDELYE